MRREYHWGSWWTRAEGEGEEGEGEGEGGYRQTMSAYGKANSGG